MLVGPSRAHFYYCFSFFILLSRVDGDFEFYIVWPECLQTLIVYAHAPKSDPWWKLILIETHWNLYLIWIWFEKSVYFISILNSNSHVSSQIWLTKWLARRLQACTLRVNNIRKYCSRQPIFYLIQNNEFIILFCCLPIGVEQFAAITALTLFTFNGRTSLCLLIWRHPNNMNIKHNVVHLKSRLHTIQVQHIFPLTLFVHFHCWTIRYLFNFERKGLKGISEEIMFSFCLVIAIVQYMLSVVSVFFFIILYTQKKINPYWCMPFACVVLRVNCSMFTMEKTFKP